MTDLYQSNRTQAAKYFQKVQASLDPLIGPNALPPFDKSRPQAFYLEYKNKITPWIQQETNRQKKELERSDNSHLLLLKRTALVDAVVTASYRTALDIYNHNRKVPLKENDVPAVIVARGGYGREEMYFSSDVDLQMVLRSEASETEKETGRQVIHYFEYLFVYQNIFHTSSSAGFSEVDAENPIFDENLLPSFHSLMEHRFVAGNPVVYNEFKSSIKTASLISRNRTSRKSCVACTGPPAWCASVDRLNKSTSLNCCPNCTPQKS